MRHLLQALGVTGRIKSPTYAVVEPYELPSLNIWHFDFYRFADAREWEDAGFRDIFASAGLKLSEWPEKAGAQLPMPDLDIFISVPTPEAWEAERSAQVKEEPAKRAGDTEQNPLPPSHPERAPTSPVVRDNAIAIAQAAKRLNDLRESWLNPKEWTDRVPEVIPLGMDKSPYPDRILPKRGHDKDLAERTLTKLYNQRPAWLDGAHKALDIAVAHAYGWADYTAAMPDDEILKRLLALNLERSAGTA